MDAAIRVKEENIHTEKLYTREDIMALPEGRRAEIINGQWYDMATPGARHQEIVSILTRKIGNYIEENGGDCKIFPAPFAVFLNENAHNWLEPDITVICDKDKIQEDGCHGAPDLVVEVTSPSTFKKDISKKLFLYRTAGVKEYWIVNPDTSSTLKYAFDDNIEKIDGDQIPFHGELTSYLYPGFSICLANYL